MLLVYGRFADIVYILYKKSLGLSGREHHQIKKFRKFAEFEGI